MAPQQKSTKQATKGSKQIVDENTTTLHFYRNMALIANATSLAVLVFFNSTINILLYLFSCGVYIGAYQFMRFMARPKYTESGQIFDSGVDLNMEGGVAEHIKDIIILTAGCQLLAALISNYFWLLWLLVPLRGFWIVWRNILAPYIFQQPSPENGGVVDEKKQKKHERRLKRIPQR